MSTDKSLEPTLIAYILEDDLEAPNADTLYNRPQITIGEPNANLRHHHQGDRQ